MADNISGDSWSFGGPVGSAQGTVGTMAGAAKIVGTWVRVEKSHGIAWTMRWTGTPVGVFSVEVSNEYDPNGGVDYPTNTVTPPDLTQLTVTIPAAVQPAGAYPAAGAGIDIAPTSFKWIRLVYTNTSSTGVLTARAHTKGY